MARTKQRSRPKMHRVPKRTFSDQPPDSPYQGAWSFGVDFAEGTNRVIAVRVGDGEIKYGLAWIGPITLNEETSPLLSKWAREALDMEGGYVHLFPADGDALEALRAATSEEGE